MSSGSRRQPELSDLVALATALERDELRPVAEVSARDQRVGTAIAAAGKDEVAMTVAWVDAVCAEDAHLASLRQRVAAVLHGAGILLTVLGLVVGGLTALGVFYYDGQSRVNAIAVLAVLVFVPAAFLVPFLLATLPSRALAFLPGATAAAALARGLSPGRLGWWFARFLPQEGRAALERLFAGSGKAQTLYAGVRKWTLLRWSQMFAFGFQVAALGATLALVVFTDLVFGWSTTLASADAAYVHGAVSALAAPWSWAVDEAVPSLELVRESRYFRAVTDPISAEQAARLGAWWSFLVMANLVYGFLPRLLSLGFADRRLRAALRATVATMPGVAGVIRRLHASRVQTTAQSVESSGGSTGPSAAAEPATAPATGRPAFVAIINWADVPVDPAWLRTGFGDVGVHRAGGSSAVADDQTLLQYFRGAPPGDGAVAIVVKVWEPPLLELVDFLQGLREALGRGREIVVVPVSVDTSGAVTKNPPAQVAVWRHKLTRISDPWLRLEEVRS